MTPVPDVARTRLDNALLLFDEFVHATVKHADAATLRGLERRFAERLQIQPSYWSQIKGRSRQIGERLARQFEQLCRKPVGWMDVPHAGPTIDSVAGLAPGASRAVTVPAPATATDPRADGLPRDDDERFIVGLVLTYYRRHPQRARTRLLDLLGEVLVPGAGGDASAAAPAVGRQGSPGATRPAPALTRTGQAASHVPGTGARPTEDDQALWQQVQAAVAPLKPRR